MLGQHFVDNVIANSISGDDPIIANRNHQPPAPPN